MIESCKLGMQITTSEETTPNQFVYRDTLNTCLHQLVSDFMYQSILAVNIPPGDPRGLAHPFCPAPWGFTYKFCARGPGFRRGQIFPELNENVLNIFIFRGCFLEAIQNGRKTVVFVAFVS